MKHIKNKSTSGKSLKPKNKQVFIKAQTYDSLQI